MILNIVFNNLNILFSFIYQRDLDIKSFSIKYEFGKNISNYFTEIDKNIEYLQIETKQLVRVICCIEDTKIREIIILYFKEKMKIFPFFIEQNHFKNFLNKVSAPIDIILNSFGVYKKYKNPNIISILCEDIISIVYIKNGMFEGYSIFPNFTLTSESIDKIKNIPDFIVSFKTESLNKDIYSAISNGIFSSTIGAIKFHINEIITNNNLNIEEIQIVASGRNLFEIPNFIQEIKDVGHNLFEIGALEIIKNNSSFY